MDAEWEMFQFSRTGGNENILFNTGAIFTRLIGKFFPEFAPRCFITFTFFISKAPQNDLGAAKCTGYFVTVHRNSSFCPSDKVFCVLWVNVDCSSKWPRLQTNCQTDLSWNGRGSDWSCPPSNWWPRVDSLSHVGLVYRARCRFGKSVPDLCPVHHRCKSKVARSTLRKQLRLCLNNVSTFKVTKESIHFRQLGDLTEFPVYTRA